jgi:medium-chain acyl-[acyl-carrier-protein] hydrolase
VRSARDTAAREHAAWLTRPLARPSARLRLFCLPYAGGSASVFRSWAERLPPDVELCPVQLPGRESRLSEPRYERIAPLTRALAHALGGELDRPVALFGHSLGALLAYELARRFQSMGATPALLCVSGHRAPHLPSRHPAVHDLPDVEFEDELRRLDGTPEPVLANPELRELMLPLLRSDFALAETYEHEPGDILDCPIVAFGGEGDPVVDEEELVGWAACTRGPFRHRMLPGRHFFLNSASDQLVGELAKELRR